MGPEFDMLGLQHSVNITFTCPGKQNKNSHVTRFISILALLRGVLKVINPKVSQLLLPKGPYSSHSRTAPCWAVGGSKTRLGDDAAIGLGCLAAMLSDLCAQQELICHGAVHKEWQEKGVCTTRG